MRVRECDSACVSCVCVKYRASEREREKKRLGEIERKIETRRKKNKESCTEKEIENIIDNLSLFCPRGGRR